MSNHLQLWVVYDRPRDFPNCFVARLFLVGPEVNGPTNRCLLARSLEGVRRMLPPGLTRLDRHPTDEPQIVETWL